MTLRQVVELYSRGGNVAPITNLDGTTIGPLGVLALTEEEIDAVVAFLEALTDERVLYRRAPFDHPQLFVPNGHSGDWSYVLDVDHDGLADDVMVEIPAVGAGGGAPLPGFMENIFGPSLAGGRPRRSLQRAFGLPERGSKLAAHAQRLPRRLWTVQ